MQTQSVPIYFPQFLLLKAFSELREEHVYYTVRNSVFLQQGTKQLLD